MDIPLVNLKKQYQGIKKPVNTSVRKILEEGNFILGKQVEEFEKAFGNYIGVKYCIGVSSGSAAIRLCLRALGVGPGDEVITVANTFISTVLPILELGGKPILVDIDPLTYQIDPKKIETSITKKTKVILVVHLYGIPAPMPQILKIARKHKLYVLEDACQAHGSSINGKRCGSFGDLAAFSFYPGKNLGAAGDGGAITTNSELKNKLKAMRNVGQFQKYKHDIFGYNSRLDTIHAAILAIKLKYLDKWNAKRRKVAALYNKLLKDLTIVLPPDMGKAYVVNYHLYVIRIENARAKERDNLLEYLHNNGIYAGIHYPIPLYLQKGIQNMLNYKKGDFPITEQFAKEIISLPIYPELTIQEVKYISDIMHQFFKERSNV